MRRWLARRVAHAASSRCLVVGVQGLQGSGKSTLCAALERTLPGCVALSLDDFYLPDAALDRAHPDPRLRGRGNPGTHDVALLRRCVDLLREGRDARVRLPVYDKCAHDGRGDRSTTERTIDASATRLVLLEGWCVGFRARGWGGDAVDRHLRAYAPLFDSLDGLVVLRADVAWVREWRRQAEPEGGMRDVDAFVDRFLPTYDAYLQRLYDEEGDDPTRRLVVTLDRDRRLRPTSG